MDITTGLGHPIPARRLLGSENPGTVVGKDHSICYREMFVPGVTAGLLKPADLEEQRNGLIYICCSMHIPPSCEAAHILN